MANTGDKVQGAISFTPIVEITADADADAVNAIHHNINQSLGGDLTYSFTDALDKWYYAPNVIAVASNDMRLIAGSADGSSDDNTDLVGATGDPAAPNEAAGSAAHFTSADGPIDCGTDDVKFLFIKNTGTSDTSGTTTTNSVYFTLDDNDSTAHSTTDAIEVASGEAWMGRINGTIMDEIHIIAGEARGAGTAASVNGSADVRCTVAAIIDDVSV